MKQIAAAFATLDSPCTRTAPTTPDIALRTRSPRGSLNKAMLSMALYLREQNLSLRDIAARLVITIGKRQGRHPSPATVLRMLREHDEANFTAPPAAAPTTGRPADYPLPSSDERGHATFTMISLAANGCMFVQKAQSSREPKDRRWTAGGSGRLCTLGFTRIQGRSWPAGLGAVPGGAHDTATATGPARRAAGTPELVYGAAPA
ncbi:hypothetical protein ACSDR0_44695 [Streptosporangium sp. G11]|uniref:hypothetical protein n=1 Tax=Streptosporangium sp. G11 TaxID=3436926 RepID=UPI003EC0819A